MSTDSSLFAAVEFAIGALRSNQDVLLHKVPRTEVVREQLEINRTAIVRLQSSLADAPEPQKPRHEWDDVRWQESDGDYESSCWCGWTDTAWAYDSAEESLREHLKENGVTVP